MIDIMKETFELTAIALVPLIVPITGIILVFGLFLTSLYGGSRRR